MKISKKYVNLRVIITVLILLSATVIFVYLKVENQHITNDKKIVIGFCTDNFVIERWQRDQQIFKEKALEEGVEVILYNANEDNDNQNKQIRLLIKKKVDVIVVVPYKKDGITKAVEEARKAGIKVIAYDRLITGTQIDAYISFDNVKVGELQAKALIEKVPKGKYVIINGSPEDNNSLMFNKGYMNELFRYINNGQIEIIAEDWAIDWRENFAYELVSKSLDRGTQIDAIIGANDRLAEAAIKALAEEGLAGKVFVAGHDAEISACQRIIEGTQYVTIYKPIRVLAEMAVDTAIKLAKGKDIQAQETIYNGVVDVPYIKLDVLSVTKETMEETVVKDGFHKKSDIYRK